MSQLETEVDQVLKTLVHEMETVLQALHRGEVHDHTAKLEAEAKRSLARDAVLAIVGAQRPVGGADPGRTSPFALAPEELAAITRCITGWLPMGDPAGALPESRCIPAAREIAPSWGEREKARLAIRRSTANSFPADQRP